MQKIKHFIANIFLFFVKKFYKIIRKDFTTDDRNTWLQFLGFAIVGCANFVVNYVVANGFYYLIWRNEQVAIICGFIISVLNAFYWNNKYVFKGNRSFKELLISLLKTYISYGITGLALAEGLTYVEVDILHIPFYIALFINLIITTPINFFLNKLWAFNDRSGMKEMFDEEDEENNSSTE